jgi:23S rRNA pseudouridine2605 synthase
MLQAVGHDVMMLRRVRFGPLTLGELKRGQWRELTEKEIDDLKKA